MSTAADVAAGKTETHDYTLLIAAVAVGAFFLYKTSIGKKHSDNDDAKEEVEISAEDKKKRGLLFLGAAASILVFNNKEELSKHLPLLSPLAVSNYTKEFGASPTIATVCAIIAYILITA